MLKELTLLLNRLNTTRNEVMIDECYRRAEENL